MSKAGSPTKSTSPLEFGATGARSILSRSGGVSPAATPSQGRVRWAILAGLTLVTFPLLLDDTAVSVALPTIQRQLGLSLTGLEWVIALAAAILATLTMRGRRRPPDPRSPEILLGATPAPGVGTAGSGRTQASSATPGGRRLLRAPANLRLPRSLFAATVWPAAFAAIAFYELEDSMPGLTGRIATFFKAKISKLLDRSEDPAETLDYAYERQLEDLQNVKRGIADVVTAKKRLQLQEATLKQQTDKLNGQAREAMSAGQEDLARAALERKHLISGEADSLDHQVAELESEQQKLTDAEQQLRTKIEAFRTKKEVIKAQYSAAEAQVRISEAATGVGGQMADVGLAMQRAVEKTEDMKARASAVEELQAAGTFDDLTTLGPEQDDIDRQLEQIGAKTAVDDDVTKLKAEFGPGAAGVSAPA